MFKNKKKKKIIKGYQSEKRAISKFKSLIKENNIDFGVTYENAEYVTYELGLLTNQDSYQVRPEIRVYHGPCVKRQLRWIRFGEA